MKEIAPFPIAQQVLEIPGEPVFDAVLGLLALPSGLTSRLGCGCIPVRVSRGTEGSGGEEQKTCLSGASLFCVRQIVSTGVCLRSRPNGVGVAGSPEGEPVPPLGPPGEGKLVLERERVGGWHLSGWTVPRTFQESRRKRRSYGQATEPNT